MSIDMKSIRTTILTSQRNRRGPLGAPFRKIFIIYPMIFFLNQNDVEFDFSIGLALGIFPII